MGHLTKGAHVYLDRVEHFIQIIGSFEDMIFSKRAKRLEGQKRRRARDKAQKDRDTAAANSPYGQPNSPYGAAGSPYSSGNSPYGGGANGSGGPRGERGGKKSAADKRLDEAAHMARMVADAIPLNMGGDTKVSRVRGASWMCRDGDWIGSGRMRGVQRDSVRY